MPKPTKHLLRQLKLPWFFFPSPPSHKQSLFIDHNFYWAFLRCDKVFSFIFVVHGNLLQDIFPRHRITEINLFHFISRENSKVLMKKYSNWFYGRKFWVVLHVRPLHHVSNTNFTISCGDKKKLQEEKFSGEIKFRARKVAGEWHFP